MSRAAIKYQSYFISFRTNRACVRTFHFWRINFFLLLPSLSRFSHLSLSFLSFSPSLPLISFCFVVISRLVSRNLHMALRVNGARPQ